MVRFTGSCIPIVCHSTGRANLRQRGWLSGVRNYAASVTCVLSCSARWPPCWSKQYLFPVLKIYLHNFAMNAKHCSVEGAKYISPSWYKMTVWINGSIAIADSAIADKIIVQCSREGFKNPNHDFLPWWGGDTPLYRDFFPLTFWPATCRDWGEGGTPLCRD